MDKLERKVDFIERSLKSKDRRISELSKSKRTLLDKNRVLSNDIHNYISAVRYYEDTLESMGCRRDILRREDLGKIFDEDEEDGWS